jgi:hypothetical protein
VRLPEQIPDIIWLNLPQRQQQETPANGKPTNQAGTWGFKYQLESLNHGYWNNLN